MSVKAETMNFNKGWKFILEDVKNAEQVRVDDGSWRQLSVPHDWSIEFAFDEENCQGCTGYLPGGIGWYRKTFKSPESIEEAKVYLNFDGIYNHSKVYVNGALVSDRPYGYVPITVEVSEHMNAAGEDNVVAVRVDHSRFVDSRWYSGSGIYRDVKMLVTDQLHIPINGSFITTPEVAIDKATVNAEITLRNQYETAKSYELKYQVMDANGTVVAELTGAGKVEAASDIADTQELVVASPELWDVESPIMYQLVTKLILDGEEIQTYVTKFGFRTIEFDADKGFFLNGVNTLIKGVCLHHDGGLVGSAVPKGVWRRKLQILRDGGCNAIRTAHNPVSEEFLDLCDEMGFMVQDEFYDEWDYWKDKRGNGIDTHGDYLSEGLAAYFHEWAERDLKDVMLRDRNHPCVIQWSIGNEIEWIYPETKRITGYFGAETSGNYFWELPPYGPEKIKKNYEEGEKSECRMEDTAKNLSGWVKEMDLTRPVTMNCILPSASYEMGVADALDVIGYSYRRVVYDFGHERMPHLPLMGAENLGQWHEWKAIEERDFVCGTFLWTGIDYLGESQDQWPIKATRSGLIDTAGFTKGSWHMMKTLWNQEAHIHIATNTKEASVYRVEEDGSFFDTTNGGWGHRLWVWHDINNHWNYTEGEEVVVEVYTNCEEVELILEGDGKETSYGSVKLAECEDHVMKWLVPFTSGRLKAVSKETSYEVSTASTPAKMKVCVDQEALSADGCDVAHVVVQLTDENGNIVRHEEARVSFEVSGPCKVLGVDNGDSRKMDQYQADSLMTSEGRCMIIVQSTEEQGDITITAKADSVETTVVTIRSK